jgi:hypothetical protein
MKFNAGKPAHKYKERKKDRNKQSLELEIGLFLMPKEI